MNCVLGIGILSRFLAYLKFELGIEYRYWEFVYCVLAFLTYYIFNIPFREFAAYSICMSSKNK